MGVSFVIELKWVIRRRWMEAIKARKCINKLFISHHSDSLANYVHCVVYWVETLDGDFPIVPSVERTRCHGYTQQFFNWQL